jgi:hypothetical protein
VTVTKLVQRDGPGVGYDVVLRNDSSEDLFANAIEISGTHTVEIYGAGAMLERAVYDVVLDSSVAEASGLALDGTAYDASSPDFGAKCAGRFTFELNTTEHQKSWEYSFFVPIVTRIPAKDRVVVRILFRRNSRSLVERTIEGSSGGFNEPGIVKVDRHSLIVKLENGEALLYAVGRDFLTLVVEREKLSEDKKGRLDWANTCIRHAEDFRDMANQRTGSTCLEFLESALSAWQSARKAVEALPRDYQELLPTIDRSIAELDKEIAAKRQLRW